MYCSIFKYKQTKINTQKMKIKVCENKQKCRIQYLHVNVKFT